MFYSINGNLIEKFELHSNEFKSTISDVVNEECANLRNELSILFQNYNDAVSAKIQAELNVENIKKQLLEAQNEADSTISNINKAVEEYNNVLIKLHNFKCTQN